MAIWNCRKVLMCYVGSNLKWCNLDGIQVLGLDLPASCLGLLPREESGCRRVTPQHPLKESDRCYTKLASVSVPVSTPMANG